MSYYADWPGFGLPPTIIGQIVRPANNVWYVSKGGSDNFNGKAPDSAKLTIAAAYAAASANDLIVIAPGTYDEPQDWSSKGIDILGANRFNTLIRRTTDTGSSMARMVVAMLGPFAYRIQGIGFFSGVRPPSDVSNDSRGGIDTTGGATGNLDLIDCWVRTYQDTNSGYGCGGGLKGNYNHISVRGCLIEGSEAGLEVTCGSHVVRDSAILAHGWHVCNVIALRIQNWITCGDESGGLDNPATGLVSDCSIVATGLATSNEANQFSVIGVAAEGFSNLTARALISNCAINVSARRSTTQAIGAAGWQGGELTLIGCQVRSQSAAANKAYSVVADCPPTGGAPGAVKIHACDYDNTKTYTGEGTIGTF